MKTDNLENAYTRAMEMLEKGHSKEEVLLEFSQFKNDLTPLLDISLELLTLPKNLAPQPAMQRKYAFTPSKQFWLAWMHVSKFAAVSMSLMLLLSAFAVTAYASYSALPGQSLFAVKKLEEKTQLMFAFNPNDRANLQIKIAQNRLSEAQAIFSNPTSDAESKNAALNELSDQTSSAVAVVGTVANSDLKSDQNNPLLNSLANITQQQQQLLTQITPNSQVNVAASSAMETLIKNSAQISEIKQSVAAASDDQTLTKLSSASNAVAVLGEISQISKNQITIEKTTFTITPQTVIQDSDGNPISPGALQENSKVNVVGVKNQNTLLAQQIFVTAPDNSTQPEVKGAATLSQDSASGVTATTSTGTSISLKKPADATGAALPAPPKSSPKKPPQPRTIPMTP